MDGEQLLGEWPQNSARSINFQYFQQISGAIETADVPDSAKLRVSLTLQDGNVLQNSYAVAELLKSIPVMPSDDAVDSLANAGG
jgi:hypothetical protein